MKKNTKIITVIAAFTFVIIIGALGVFPSIYENQCKTRHDDDMERKLENIFSANIGVITVTEHDDIKGYSAGASGVIFDKVEGQYFALTAYHVIADQNTYLVLNTKDETLGTYRKKHSSVGISEYYEQLAKATVEYTCKESDLAIISFKSGEELATIPIADEVPVKGTQLAAIGNWESRPFEITYGRVTSNNLVTFHVDDKQGDNRVLHHNAYVAPGSSGGAVVDSNMELVGINIGGGTDIFGRFKYGAMIPCNQVQQCIDNWKNQSVD